MAYNQFTSASARQDTGESDFFDGVTDFFQYGVTSSLTSGVLSMANTGVSLANTFGASYDYFDTSDTLKNLGLTETSKYYQSNQDALDTVGFVLTSIIPGTAGVKAARAALRGGASSSVKLISGLSEATNKSKYVEQMTDLVRKGAVEESISSVKRKAIAAGFYKNAVEAAAAETAIALTMNQNPVLANDDLNYFSAVGNYMTSTEFWLGAGLGTTIGGTIDAAATHFAYKRLDKAVQKQVNAIAPVSDVGELAVSKGDATAYAAVQLRTLVEEGVEAKSGVLNQRVKDNVDTQRKVVNESLLNLTRNDTDIAQPLMAMVTDTNRTSQEVGGMFAGATSITRPWKSEELLDVPSKISRIVPIETFNDTMVDYLQKSGVDLPPIKLREYVEKRYSATQGLAITNPRVRGYESLALAKIKISGDYAIDTINEGVAMKVLRHEIGHLTANHLDTFFTKTKLGKELFKEGEALSRMISPERWADVDAAIRKITKGEIKGDEALETYKFRQYLASPRELLAESFAVLDDAKLYGKASKLAPRMTKLLESNRALRQQFGPTKKYINLATGEGTTGAVTFTVADVGPVTVKGTKVMFGRDGDQVVDASKNFDPVKLDPLEASAYWYAWMSPDSKLAVAAGETVKYNDLPRLAKVSQQLRTGSMSLDDTIKVAAKDGTVTEVPVTDVEELMRTTKGKYAEEMRGAQVDDPELDVLAPTRTYNEIARILDVDRDAALLGGKNARIDGANWSFSEAYDPTKPLHAVARYKRDTLDDFQIRGMISVNDRIRLAREHADSLTSNYYKDFASTLPESGYKSGKGYNPAADIGSSDKATSALGATQGEYLDGTSFFQSVGAFLDTWTKRKSHEITNKLAPHAEVIKADPKAMIELSVLDSVLRRDHYIFMDSIPDNFSVRIGEVMRRNADNPAAVEEATNSLKAVMQAMEDAGLADLAAYKGRNQIWTEAAAKEFNAMLDKGITDVNAWRRFSDEFVGDYKTKHINRIESEAVVNFWATKVAINDEQVLAMQRVKAAKGKGTNARVGRLYPGAYDTSRMRYVAYVSDAKEEALSGTRSVGIIGAVDEKTLRLKMQQVQERWGDSVVVTTRNEKKRYLEMQGRYSRQNDVDDLVMDSELKKNGIAFDVLPEPDAQILSKYLNDAVNYETSISRNHIEVKYGEELAALRNYGREAKDVSTSMFGFLKSSGKALNAWEQQEKVMLNISNNDAFAGWKNAQQGLDEVFSRAYSAVADAVTTASTKGWNDASRKQLEETMERYGFKGAYDANGYAGQALLANAPIKTRGVLSGLMSQANGLTARLMLRMDSAHGIVNAMSLPIMMIPETMALRGVVSKELANVLDVAGHVRIPKTDKVMPSNAKVMMQATKDFFRNRELVKDYIAKGIVPSNLRDVLEAVDGMTDFGTHASAGNLSKAKQALLKAEELIGKPVDISEQFSHFVAARAADLMLTPAVNSGVISEGTKLAAMQSFMRRVNGNYIAAQRPQLFQGWAGQAIGLFQTYQMNMMYNMFRYMGTEKRGAAAMVAAQTSIFGVQSLPGFEWLNNKILDRTQGETDFYIAGQEMFGEEGLEWGMYGLASNFTKPLLGEGIALHTRGNLSPHNPTILPTNISELPAVSAMTNFVTSVGTFVDNVGNGAPVSQAFYHALAHNGLNRPLQGIGQMMQDGVTTKKNGNLLVSVDQLDWWENATRLTGAKPLDEAIALENFYRMEKYKTRRAEDIQRLGGALKEKVRYNEPLDNSDVIGFMQDYVAEGGSYETFERWMFDTMLSATQSQVDLMRQSLTSTEGRYLQRVMNGGVSD